VSSEFTPTTSPTGWTRSSAEPVDGSIAFRLPGWPRFADLLNAEIFQTAAGAKRNYIWRGQRDIAWSLSSSLDRLFGKLGLLAAGPNVLEARSREHLDAFKYASRGRRGQSPSALSDNEWWALANTTA
jgi:FRG domain